MSRELIHLVVLLNQGIEVNRSQIKHCANMQEIIEESIVPGMDAEHILAAGAILGWGLGSSGVYIAQNIDKLIQVLDKLELDVEELRASNEPLDEGPDRDVALFVNQYINKAREQMQALENLKTYLLSDAFDETRLDLVYSDKGKSLLEDDFEESLKKLLQDE